ncbi:MAG: hypothetical protein QOJ16_1482 [Acidobacteriota bacterium]|jgi:hypothetical protein|nr:hypothetical protein [Acidobacteriota bacterium]
MKLFFTILPLLLLMAPLFVSALMLRLSHKKSDGARRSEAHHEA